MKTKYSIRYTLRVTVDAKDMRLLDTEISELCTRFNGVLATRRRVSDE